MFSYMFQEYGLHWVLFLENWLVQSVQASLICRWFPVSMYRVQIRNHTSQ